MALPALDLAWDGRQAQGGERVAVVCVAVMLAAASWYLIEEPILRLKRHFEPAGFTGASSPGSFDVRSDASCGPALGPRLTDRNEVGG